MILEVNKISKSYAEHLVLDKVTFSVKQGEVIALIGPSGSGKSTILRTINFLDAPDEGEIKFKDVVLNEKNTVFYRQKIGMLFQNFNLFPHMTVLENIIFAPIKLFKENKNEATKEAFALLHKVGLEDKAFAKPNSLSGGQKQRVAIARSLAMNPEILLLDEPTSALDPEMVQEVLNVIKSFVHSGITIIMSTHEMNFAKNFADKVLFLDQGKIIEDSSPQEFFNMPQTDRAALFLSKILG